DHARGAVAITARQIRASRTYAVAEVLISPAQFARQPLGIRIEQELAGVEAKPLLRLVRTMDPVSVQLARAGAWQIAVPDLVCLFGQAQAGGLPAIGGVEQTQVHGPGALREQGEV